MNRHPEYPLDPSPTAEPIGPGTEARPSGSLVVRSYQDALGVIADLRARTPDEVSITAHLAEQNTAAQDAYLVSFAPPPRPNRRQRRAIQFGRLK